MTRRLPRHGDHYLIRAARTAGGDLIPRRWYLAVNPLTTDDQVILPGVYFRPLKTRFGITREAVIIRISARDALTYGQTRQKFDTQRDALAAARALQARFGTKERLT